MVVFFLEVEIFPEVVINLSISSLKSGGVGSVCDLRIVTGDGVWVSDLLAPSQAAFLHPLFSYFLLQLSLHAFTHIKIIQGR